jgi:hypothetical protein
MWIWAKLRRRRRDVEQAETHDLLLADGTRVRIKRYAPARDARLAADEALRLRPLTLRS